MISPWMVMKKGHPIELLLIPCEWHNPCSTWLKSSSKITKIPWILCRPLCCSGQWHVSTDLFAGRFHRSFDGGLGFCSQCVPGGWGALGWGRGKIVCNIAMQNGPFMMVYLCLPIKHGDFLVRYVKLPDGKSPCYRFATSFGQLHLVWNLYGTLTSLECGHWSDSGT